MKWWSDEISWMKSSALPWMKWWRDEVSFSSTTDEVMKWWSPNTTLPKLKKQNAFLNSNGRVLVAPRVNYAQVLLRLNSSPFSTSSFMNSSALSRMKWWSDEISWMKSSAQQWMKWWRDEVSFRSATDEVDEVLKSWMNSSAQPLLASLLQTPLLRVRHLYAP